MEEDNWKEVVEHQELIWVFVEHELNQQMVRVILCVKNVVSIRNLPPTVVLNEGYDEDTAARKDLCTLIDETAYNNVRCGFRSMKLTRGNSFFFPVMTHTQLCIPISQLITILFSERKQF